jgi:broad specificity phosphatase PhoE
MTGRHDPTPTERLPSRMTTMLLVRHGETDWNRDNRFQGHADPPLNDRGREQARELASRLAGERVDAVYTSPLRRARETAEIIGAALVLPVAAHEGLREVDVGEWQGLTRDEIAARYPGAFARWLAYGHGWEEGETYEEMAVRALAAVRDISAVHPGGRLAVVTHGGPVRAVLAHSEGMTHAEARRRGGVIANCGVASFAVEDGRVRAVD